MPQLEKLIQSIDDGTATMADVEQYIADTTRERERSDKRRAADISRLVKAHAEFAHKQAVEARLHGRSRIAYALAHRK